MTSETVYIYVYVIGTDIQKGHQDMEGKMKLMGDKLGEDVKEQRETLKELQSSLGK